MAWNVILDHMVAIVIEGDVSYAKLFQRQSCFYQFKLSSDVLKCTLRETHLLSAILGTTCKLTFTSQRGFEGTRLRLYCWPGQQNSGSNYVGIHPGQLWQAVYRLFQ